MSKTTSIHLGTAEDFVSVPDPSTIPDNLITIHRSHDPLKSAWGNFCSKIVTRLHNRAENNLSIRWYHEKIYNFCYAQYDKYGDYYKIIDSSYATYEQDGIYEVI